MKTITAWFTMLLMSLLMLPALANAAVPPVQLFMDGKPLVAEVAPQIVGGNTIVPVRIIAESIGSTVSWESKERKVTISKDETSIQLFIDKKNAVVNDKTFQLETAPAIIDGNTMLPLRFVSEQLGVGVTWEEPTRSVFLYKPKQTAAGQSTGTADGPKRDNPAGNAPSGQTAGQPPKDQTGQPADQSKDQPAFVAAPGTAVKAGETAGDSKTDNVGTIGKTDSPAPPPAAGDKAAASGEPLVQAISVNGDTVTIKTTDKTLKPKSFLLAEPNRIVIDVPRAKLDETLASKVGPNKEGIAQGKSEQVSQIRYSLFSNEPSIVRIVIDLPKKYEFMITDVQQNGEFSVKIGQAGQAGQQGQPGQAKARYTVVIDPGHGGSDTGAISVTKRNEKDFVLALGTKVAALLQKESKIEVVMTRSNDTFIELSERAGKANEIGADLFVSIHGNSASKESVSGTETYYYTPQSQDFANLMHKYLLEGTGFPDRKVKKESFHVIRNTTMPSVLLEVGFLSSRSDEALMYQEAFQNQVAASIVAAIKKQLNID